MTWLAWILILFSFNLGFFAGCIWMMIVSDWDDKDSNEED